MEITENTPPPAPPATFDVTGLTREQAEDLLALMAYVAGINKSRERTFTPLYNRLVAALHPDASSYVIPTSSLVREYAEDRLANLRLEVPGENDPW